MGIGSILFFLCNINQGGVPDGMALKEYLELGLLVIAEASIEYMINVKEPHVALIVHIP